MEELKPCPFCGAPGGLEQDFGTRENWVICTNPCVSAEITCPVKPATVIYDSPEDAIAAWNTRQTQGRGAK